MATSGLSRRRGGGAGAGSGAESRASSSPSEGTSTPPPHTHAGSAFAGGSKIAYDPRDLISEDGGVQGGGKMPRLTLMEEVLLMGIKDKQGYLSFWNDNISYALRGCVLIELALRRRIALVKDPHRRRFPLPERLIEVINPAITGETILDETLRMMRETQSPPPAPAGSAPPTGEKMSVNTWIDLLSGETWNVLKIGYQLKQVRERLAKGLVDKGVLRTEKRNFLLFDMATHPLADTRAKEAIITRVIALLRARTSSLPKEVTGGEMEGVREGVLRSVCLICTAYTASVLDNALSRMGYEEREEAFQRADEILAEFSVHPFGGAEGVEASGNTPRKRNAGSRIAMGGLGDGRESILGLVGEVNKGAGEEDTTYELIAAVLDVLAKLDSLI